MGGFFQVMCADGLFLLVLLFSVVLVFMFWLLLVTVIEMTPKVRCCISWIKRGKASTVSKLLNLKTESKLA